MVDRISQLKNIPKEETTGPTAAMESELLKYWVDAKGYRYVYIFDIHNAFAQNPIGNEKVIMKITVKLSELLIKRYPKLYTKCFTMVNGKSVLYVDIFKALYGLLKSEILLYKQIVKCLKEIWIQVKYIQPRCCKKNRD